MVVLVLFALCLSPLAWMFSLVGVIGCRDPEARRNAIIVFAISSVLLGVSLVVRVSRATES